MVIHNHKITVKVVTGITGVHNHLT